MEQLYFIIPKSAASGHSQKEASHFVQWTVDCYPTLGAGDYRIPGKFRFLDYFGIFCTSAKSYNVSQTGNILTPRDGSIRAIRRTPSQFLPNPGARAGPRPRVRAGPRSPLPGPGPDPGPHPESSDPALRLGGGAAQGPDILGPRSGYCPCPDSSVFGTFSQTPL